jgi:UDPglucose 6-dehydrogenase
MRISVMGTGYLGAVHAACMAHLGHEVCAYDSDASKIDMLSAGTSPFYEPGFEDLLAAELGTGRLRLTHDAQEAISGATVHFVCVGTPQLPASNAADVQHVDRAVKTIAAHSDCPGVIVGKSTSRTRSTPTASYSA